MMGLGRGANISAGELWKGLPFGFKFVGVTCFITTIFSLFTSFFLYIFVNDVTLTVNSFQIWRLLTSWMIVGSGFSSIITYCFSNLMLYSILPEIERKLSTAFMITQIFLQNLIVNIVFTLLLYPLFLLEIVSDDSLFSYGCYPLIMVFIWRGVKQNPNGQSQFCFFPCLIPNKYIPLCFLAMFLFFGGPFLLNCIACFVGYIEFIYLDQMLIKLPLSYYRKIDALLPGFIINRADYVKVNQTQTALVSECGCCWKSRDIPPHNASRNFQDHFANPFQPQQPISNQNVEVVSGGVAIGGNLQQHRMNYKQHWANYDNEKTQDEEGVRQRKQVNQGKQAKQAKQAKQGKQEKEREKVGMGNESMMTEKSLMDEDEPNMEQIPSISPGEIEKK